MLELFGSGYVIDHVVAEHNRHMEERLFREYVGDLLMFVAEGKRAVVPRRYAELIEPPKDEPENGDEIALEIIEKLGLKGSTDGTDATESDPVA